MPTPHPTIHAGEASLERLLRGGFRLPHDPTCGLAILLRGKPGTGKSTLALQTLDAMSVEDAGGGTPHPVRRYYCTLEQSKGDLAFKLAAMRVAQAIRLSLRPDYKKRTLACDPNIFHEHLKGKVDLPQFPDERISWLIGRITVPLFHEAPDEAEAKRAEAERAEAELAGLVMKRHDENRLTIIDRTVPDEGSSSEAPLGMLRSRVVIASRILGYVLREIDKTKPQNASRDSLPLVVIDGLSLLSVSERDAFELQRIIEKLRRNCQVAILVYEPNEDESISLDHHADMVIQLGRRTIEKPLGYLIHELCIRKARYQEAALGQHQFKIRGSGIAVFPSLHFQVHHHNYMDLELIRSSDKDWVPTRAVESKSEECREGSLIDLIFNPRAGESTVLLGPRNSFKTQLCLDFLSRGNWGCPKGKTAEKGLLISLIDNAPQIQQGLVCPWKNDLWPQGDAPCHQCASAVLEHARPFCQRPGCITPSEFFHYLRESIISFGKAAKRLVFWDLTQMDYRFPLFREDRMLLPAMMDLFKTEGLKSLFMGAGNADNTKAASAMADHVLFCWRSDYVPKQRRASAASGAKPVSSLMLYVDRTSVAVKKSGKVLYCIPVHEHDKLQVPMRPSDLDKEGCRLSLTKLKLEEPDRKQIERITNMQGVE
jgi:KaiC/GvpD/RAD55 family RecA-like ATPase